MVNYIGKNDVLGFGVESKLEAVHITCAACGEQYEFVDFSTDLPMVAGDDSFIIELNAVGFLGVKCIKCESESFNMKAETSLLMYSMKKKESENDKNL